jgi:hypothetical protein
MTATDKITPAQRKFVLSLLQDREVDDADTILKACRISEDPEEFGMSRRDASAVIDRLKAAPRATPIADAVQTYFTDERIAELEATQAPVPPEPGVFKVGDEIFIVKLNQAKTNVYAKRLVETSSDRLTEGDDLVRIDFEYAPGAVYRITEADRMSLDEAKSLMIRYGRCIACGRFLKVAQSVERGIGPVCIKYFRQEG